MPTTVVPVRSRRELRRFLALPWLIYRGNPYWVPPLLAEQRRELAGVLSPDGEKSRALFLALRDGRPAGRVAAVVDRTLNQAKQSQTGYFSLFECVDGLEVAAALFDAAGAWLRGRGLAVLKGPVSPEGPHGDDCKGLLVDAFDRPPVLMTSYNPPYYQGLIEGCGFAKDFDVYAYLLDKDRLFNRDPGKVIEYAQRRYGFRLDTVKLANLDDEIRAVKHVLDLAVPAEWPDMIAPSLEELQAMAERMRPIADPDLVVIARAGDEPVGFGIALPDYNRVLIHLNGRMTPLAILKYLYYRRTITWARIFIMFVVPAFRKKGVAHAIYYHIFLKGTGKGYTHGEGSTIGEPNTQMRTDIESIGGQRYKTYRIYRKELLPFSPTVEHAERESVTLSERHDQGRAAPRGSSPTPASARRSTETCSDRSSDRLR